MNAHPPPPPKAPPPLRPARAVIVEGGWWIEGAGVAAFTRGEAAAYLVAYRGYTLDEAGAVLDALERTGTRGAHRAPDRPPRPFALGWQHLDDRTRRLSPPAGHPAATLAYRLDGRWWLEGGPLPRPADCGPGLADAMTEAEHLYYEHVTPGPV